MITLPLFYSIPTSYPSPDTGGSLCMDLGIGYSGYFRVLSAVLNNLKRVKTSEE